MALARIKNWNPGDTLTAADLNAEFNNPLNNPISLISPTTGAINFQTSVAHSNLVASAISGSSGGGLPATISIVRGLTGTVTSSQTVTLAADQYLLQTTAAFPTFFTMSATGTFTVNVGNAGTSVGGSSGPTVNGRDIATLFSSTFVHVYAISTGGGSTTPAGIASTTPPPTGPVMPTNYNTWAYLGTYAYSSASTTFLASQRARCGAVWYDSEQSVLADGQSTAITAIALGSVVPAIALDVKVHSAGGNNAAAANGAPVLAITSSGTTFCGILNTAGLGSFVSRFQFEAPNLSQTLFYNLNGTSIVGVGGGCYVSIAGYTVPNGA